MRLEEESLVILFKGRLISQITFRQLLINETLFNEILFDTFLFFEQQQQNTKVFTF